MTHICYAKPQMFQHPRGPHTITERRLPVTLHNPFLSFDQLQGLPSLRYQSGTLEPSWVFAPFSATITGRVKQDFRLAAPHPQVLSTSRQVLSPHMTDELIPSRQHSKGLGLQSITLKRSVTVFQCLTSSSFPSFHDFLF